MFYLPSSDLPDKAWRHYLLLMMPDWKAYQIYASITMFLLVFRTQVDAAARSAIFFHHKY